LFFLDWITLTCEVGECNIVPQQYCAISALLIAWHLRLQRIHERFRAMINVDLFLAKNVDNW